MSAVLKIKCGDNETIQVIQENIASVADFDESETYCNELKKLINASLSTVIENTPSKKLKS